MRSNYRILGLIGQGQFGKVYCGAHRKSGKLVALKSLDRYRLSTQQFLRELRFLLSLRHRNIVACQALENTPRGRYLVMDYCPGGTLRDLLEEEQCLVSWPVGLTLMIDVLKGLEHAHAQKIIHCDIKPENILLDPTLKGWVARITDFGIARVLQDTEEGGDNGSPAYMAPERFYGQYHQNSDLYAVGIMLFELFTGRRPFSGTPMDLRLAHMNEQPVIPESVPSVLVPIIQKALKKLPGQRFQTAREMREALEQALPDLNALPSDRSPYFRLPSDLPPCQILPPPAATWSFPTSSSNLRFQAVSASQDSGSPAHLMAYWTEDRQVFEQILPEKSLAPFTCNVATAHRSLTLPEAILDLVLVDGNCWILGQHNLFLWALAVDQPIELSEVAATVQTPELYLSPQQNWFMVLDRAQQQLYFDRIGKMDMGNPRSLRSLTLTDPVIQAFPVDDGGHGIVLMAGERTTILQLLNRRGLKMGTHTLPLVLEDCFLTPKPYRLVGIEAGAPHLLVLDLKPYRLKRINLPDIPHTLTCFSWGYAVSSDRSVFMLDLDGRLIGHFEDRPDSTYGIVQIQAIGDRLILVRQTPQEAIVELHLIQDLNLDLLF